MAEAFAKLPLAEQMAAYQDLVIYGCMWIKETDDGTTKRIPMSEVYAQDEKMVFNDQV